VPVVLAAIAPVTKRIRLTRAVTVLNTADPVASLRASPRWIYRRLAALK